VPGLHGAVGVRRRGLHRRIQFGVWSTGLNAPVYVVTCYSWSAGHPTKNNVMEAGAAERYWGRGVRTVADEWSSSRGCSTALRRKRHTKRNVLSCSYGDWKRDSAESISAAVPACWWDGNRRVWAQVARQGLVGPHQHIAKIHCGTTHREGLARRGAWLLICPPQLTTTAAKSSRAR